MVETNAAVLATEKAWNDWGSSTTKDKISDRAYYIAKHWNDDIDEGDGDYSITVYNHHSDKPSINNPSDTCDAMSSVRDKLANNTNVFSSYDSVVVLDSRTFDGGTTGCAYRGTAGGNWAVGYVNGDGGNTTAAHELAHTYGAKHAETKEEAENGESTFESTSYTHSLVGKYGAWDCNVNHSYTSEGHWFADCTKNAVKNHIDNNI